LEENQSIHQIFVEIRARGLKIGVVSNGTLVEQVETLVRLGIVNLIDAIVISEEYGYEKPSAKLFDVIAESLSISKSNILLVGDDWKSDIVGGFEAGMKVALLTQYVNSRPKCEIKLPYYLIENITDVLSLLNRYFRPKG
jgi:putative hydrolase of the HAD superfamily